MASWVTKRKDRKGRTVYVLRSSTVDSDGNTKTTQRVLGRDKKYAAQVVGKIKRSETFWGAGLQIQRNTRDLLNEIPIWLGSKDRSEAHINMVLKSYERFLDLVQPPKHLVDVRPSDIDRYCKALLVKGLSPHTVDLELRNLRLVFRRAQRENYIVKCPVTGDSFIHAELPERTVIPFEHMVRFFVGCEHDLAQFTYFRIIAVTGMRSTELARRNWDDIIDNGQDGLCVNVTKTKTKKPRTVPLDSASSAMLRLYWDKEGCPTQGRVFPGKWVKTLWHRRCQKICSRANLPPYSPHNFRHSLRPLWRQLRRTLHPRDGIRLEEIVAEALLGHSLKGVGRVHYDRIDLEDLQAAVQVYGAWLEKIYREAKSQNRDTYVTQDPKTRFLKSDRSTEVTSKPNFSSWYPQGESNPCDQTENLAS